jgi:hypothetical protein
VTEPEVTWRPPDPRKAYYIFASGMKNRGKSHYCRQWFDLYPFDKLVIDPTHDVRDDFRRDGIPFIDLGADTLPVRLPSSLDDDHPFVTCVYCPDMGSPTAMDDIDRAAGLVLRGRDQRAMLWLDEVGAGESGNKTPPNQRRILHHGRHHNLQLLQACPRPMDIDVLRIGQADLIVTFRTPVVYDSDRIADSIGYDRTEYADLNKAHCQGHAYTMYDRDGEQLYLMPPLPPRRAGRNLYHPIPT